MAEEMNKDLEMNEVAPETVAEDVTVAPEAEPVAEEKPKKERKPRAKKEKKEEPVAEETPVEEAPAEAPAEEVVAEETAEPVAEEKPKKEKKAKKEKVKKEKKAKSELDEESEEETEVVEAEETPEEKEKKKKLKKRLIITGICAAGAAVVAAIVILIVILSAKANAIKAFNKAAVATDPSKVSIAISQEVVGIPLEASFVTVYREDGSFEITYFRDEINTSAVDTTDFVTRKTGVVTCDASGNYSDGGEFKGTVSAPTGSVKFNFESSKINYKLTLNSNILKATVKASNTKAVFGVDVGADIDVTVTKASGKIVSFTMNYTTAEGPVTVNCFYAD